MDKNNDRFIFTMSIPLKAHEIAQQFCQKQPDANHAKQIYLNTLAVYSMNEYLGYLDIPTALTASDSWNPGMQYLSNVADLNIPNYGRLECRPVLPNEDICYVPPDVWGDRTGYVAIQFDSDLTEVTFLGFLPTVQSSAIALEEWQPFETFVETLNVETLNEVSSEDPSKVASSSTPPWVHLSQWLDGALNKAIDQGWQLIHHDFLSPELSPELSPRFRSTPHSPLHSQLTESAQVVCSKNVNWSTVADSVPLSLIIGLASSDQSEETDIWVKISTQDPDHHLPLDLELLIVDEDEQTVIQTKSRGTEGIQLRFGGQPNEQFGVKVIQGSHEIIETFVV